MPPGRTLLIGIGTCFVAFSSTAQQNPDTANTEGANAYKRLRLEELMNVEVTTVTGRPEKLTETASAIQVITRDDIRRSGATRLPEVLRLVSNLQVDQIDSGQWAVSARGFNSLLANKMLVMIDGRTIYSPLFAGVFWDIQDVLLEDVERIEVISGPGATLWGANAVNGVINVITRSAKDTEGLFLESGGGLEVRGFGGVRYGASLTPKMFLRVYGKYVDRDGMVFRNGRDAQNNYRMGQGGFRLDWEKSDADLFSLQGDIYESRTAAPITEDGNTLGANLLGRWSHKISEYSDAKLQLYFDRVHRDIPAQYNDVLDTYDVDFRYRLPGGERNDIIWGAGYRLMRDNFGPGSLRLVPRRRSLRKFSAFAQDEIAIIKDRLHLTVGTKFEHNNYTGVEVQPSARLAWRVSPQQTIWTAVSRAVRTPSRLDRELVLPGLPGSPNFDSETLLAYELGYRVRPLERLSISLATFYNDYDDIRTIERINPPAALPLEFGNGQTGESYGAELIGDYRVTNWWRLRAGHTELRIHFRRKPGSTAVSTVNSESYDSNRYFSIRSPLDLPGGFEFDPAFRYVSRIKNPTFDVPGYGELSLRLAWLPTPNIELSVMGHNLLHDHHPEYGGAINRQEMERSVYGKLAFRW